MELTNAKGMKDYMPEEMIILNDIMEKLRKSFEKAGYIKKGLSTINLSRITGQLTTL